MLQNIKPNRKKSKEGSLSKDEQVCVKGLLAMGYIPQDIVHIVNQGRLSTTNPARIYEVKSNGAIKCASEKKVLKYIKIQSSYDPKTLLNPYKHPRLIKAREAMIAAVSAFNNPSTVFKVEQFCTLANIAWTYLLHEKLERQKKGLSILGNGKAISVAAILRKEFCPIKDRGAKENLTYIIKIRDEVEHQYFDGVDKCFGSLLQACCVNFDKHLTEWFGEQLSLTRDLSLALQFVSLDKEHVSEIEAANFPKEIKAIYTSVKASPFYDQNSFDLKVYYTSEATSKTNADIHKLVSYDGVGERNEVIKKVSREKLTEKQIVSLVKRKGFKKFRAYDHQLFWKSKWKNAIVRNKKANKEYGEVFNGWGWYEEKWLPLVLGHCKEAGDKYK